MIQLASKNLATEIQTLQQKVDEEAAFLEKVDKAKKLWNSKGGTKGKKAFEDIVADLYSMCVYVGICNYCEQSEANDVEHIYPKSFFPEHAFIWDNYLLACKQCNTAYKLDRFFVLDMHDIELQRSVEPPFRTFAFINPRTEDPTTFMLLNTLSFKFDLLPDLSRKDFNKATKTLNVLQLNVRDTLLAARKSAAYYYYQRMKLLVDIVNASTKSQIHQWLTPYDEELDSHLSLNEIQQELKISFQKHISTYQHPSVWHSIQIVASKTNEKWKAIFEQIPDALHW
ncbi:MAG: HNH endonuclease [Bacteroidota bacterium]